MTEELDGSLSVVLPRSQRSSGAAAPGDKRGGRGAEDEGLTEAAAAAGSAGIQDDGGGGGVAAASCAGSVEAQSPRTMPSWVEKAGLAGYEH